MAAPSDTTSTPVEVAELIKICSFILCESELVIGHIIYLALCEALLIWPDYKDLLLVIEQLREQLSGISDSLGQCQTMLAQSGLVASPLFWLLISLVVGSFGLGCCRVVWNARRDGFFPVDR